MLIFNIISSIASSLFVLVVLFCLIRLFFVEEDERIYGFKIVIKTFLDDHKEYEIHLKKAHYLFFFYKYWECQSTVDSYERAKERLLKIKKEYEEKLAKTTVTRKIEIL